NARQIRIQACRCRRARCREHQEDCVPHSCPGEHVWHYGSHARSSIGDVPPTKEPPPVSKLFESVLDLFRSDPVAGHRNITRVSELLIAGTWQSVRSLPGFRSFKRTASVVVCVDHLRLIERQHQPAALCEAITREGPFRCGELSPSTKE